MKQKPRITFVACLPRSRSAWLANLLTHGSSFAYHEPMRWDADWQPGMVPDFEALAEEADCAHVSFCDTAFGVYWKRALEMCPEARVLIVSRPVSEIRADWNNAVSRWNMAELHDKEGAGLLGLEARQRELAHYCDREGSRRTLNVPARMLNSMGTVETVWNFCVPGWPFDRRRALMLMDLNVEAILPAYIRPDTRTVRQVDFAALDKPKP